MIPPIPVNFYATVAAVQQMSNRRAKSLDGDSSSEESAETFNAVNPSMAVQAETGARIVANRFKPMDMAQQNESIEDEEARLLKLIGYKFGVEELHGLSAAQIAAYLKVIIFVNPNQYNIKEIEQDFGLDFIGLSLIDFLDAVIDPASIAAQRAHYSFDEFLRRQDEEAQKIDDARAELERHNKSLDFNDDDPGIYSPYK